MVLAPFQKLKNTKSKRANMPIQQKKLPKQQFYMPKRQKSIRLSNFNNFATFSFVVLKNFNYICGGKFKY